MADIPLEQAVDLVKSHVVRILTPDGAGTGFLVSRSDKTSMLGIATAAHVVAHAHTWEEPIRIEHAVSGKSILIKNAQRALFLDERRDTAALLFDGSGLPLPDSLLTLAP